MRDSRPLKKILNRELLILLLILITFPWISLAATIEVTAQVDEPGCNLIDAIDAANSNSNVGGCSRDGDGDDDTILISEEIPEIKLYSALNEDIGIGELFERSGLPVITSTIHIIGQHPGLTSIVRESDDLFRFFFVYGGNLTLDNLELKNGNVYPKGDGGAIHVTLNASTTDWVFSTLALNNVQLISNTAKEGGGIYLYSGSEVTIKHSSFIDNNASETLSGGDGIGGGIRAEPILDDAPIHLRIFDSTFSNNKAEKSGGGLNFAAYRGSTLGVFNNTVVNNTADINGGGLFLLIDENLLIDDPKFENTIRVRNSIVVGNQANASGNQIYLNREELENDILITDNVIGNLGETLLEAANVEELPDNIIATSGTGDTPLAVSQIVELPISQSNDGMYFYPLASGSPAIDQGKIYYISFIYDPIFDVNVPHFSPGCAGVDDLRRAIPEYRLDQLMRSRPIGAACDIGSYESSFGDLDDQCYVVPTSNNKLVVFCL